MANLRLFLVFALLTVGFLLFQQWQIDYGPRPAPAAGPVAGTPQDVPTVPADVPTEIPAEVPLTADVPQPSDLPAAAPAAQAPTQAATQAATQPPLITVLTDVLEIQISTRGGDVVSAKLLDYPVAVETPEEVVQLFNPTAERYYVAQSGLLSQSHATPDHRQTFSAPRKRYVLAEGEEQLVVPLTWTGEDGVEVTKRYVFPRGGYRIGVEQTLSNRSERALTVNQYRQLQRARPPEADINGGFSNPERYSFMGAALYTEAEKYEKFDFEDIADETVSRQSRQGWAAMVQHYFISAWVPAADEQTTYSTSELRPTGQSPRYLVRAVSPTHQVAAGASATLSSTLFVGPKLQDTVDEVAEGLGLTVDYGIFTPFSKVLYWLLAHIHTLVGNWGWSIVLLTVLVKALFFKLTEAQYKSMAKMRKLQPRILSLKERYGDDRQKFNVAMMEIYKKEKVNPLGGCLPLLIQIPVFIALYWVLLESVELRQASFMLWIQDLSSPDPYFILPLINGAAMFMTTKLSPNPAADPIQQKIMLAMPVVFSVMFAFFQSGLVLYWAVNSVLSLAQQWVITRRIDREG